MKAVLTFLALALLACGVLSAPTYHAPNSDNIFLNETFWTGFVNASEQGETFYWLFQSRGEPSTDPLIVWFSGSSGLASEVAIFYENGPYRFETDSFGDISLKTNPYSWNNNANVLYVDQPIGIGYSQGTGYEGNEGVVASDLREVLVQFLNLFPEFEDRSFYIGGSFGTAHYLPVLAEAIFDLSPPLDANLKGILISGGLVDPFYQYQSLPQFAYDAKVINQVKYTAAVAAFKVCTNLINQTHYTEAETACLAAWKGLVGSPASFNYLNYQETFVPPYGYNFSTINQFLGFSIVQTALNTTGRKWALSNTTTTSYLSVDLVTNNSDIITLLLNSGVPIVVFVGQLDVVTNWYGTLNWMTNATWSGQEDFINADFKPVGDYGYSKAHENLVLFTVNNAGHLPSLDQPQATSVMLNAFLNGSITEPMKTQDESYTNGEFLMIDS